MLGIPTCWYLKNAKTLRYPTRNPKASQWNVGCVGSQTQNSGVGHVHFMFFVLILFAFGSQCKPSIQWNMGLHVTIIEVSWEGGDHTVLGETLCFVYAACKKRYNNYYHQFVKSHLKLPSSERNPSFVWTAND